MINEDNEKMVAGLASNAGGKLSVLKAPVEMSKDELRKKKKQSTVWGASSK